MMYPTGNELNGMFWGLVVAVVAMTCGILVPLILGIQWAIRHLSFSVN